MNKKVSNSHQLSFSIGRPLPLLIEEIGKTSRNQNLRKAASQMLEALNILENVSENGLSNSVRINQAIYEILTQ